MLNISNFIAKYVTKRPESMFQADLYAHQSALTKAIEGKSVLVIGGAGSIGSSYIKALLPFKPKTLVVVDISENGLTELTRELRSTSAFTVPTDYVTYPMNYADDTFVKMFKDRGGFDIVANFSAHKHVRSEKDKYSVEALLKNNVVNAKKFLDLLCDYPPEHFFCVSTDKAANPVNIMGGSKKIMEDMIMAYAHKFPVTTARFANVAFSNGSLPAGFLERIAKNQPLSAPSDVTRYFVSPEESGQICLMACILGTTGQIYFPKLKKGYTPLECQTETEAITKAESRKETDKWYPVYFSKSDTTGEKPYEEFYTEEEKVALDSYSSLGVISLQSFKKITEIENFIDKLNQLFDNPTTEKKDITQLMKAFLVNFDHQETGRYLDSKM